MNYQAIAEIINRNSSELDHNRGIFGVVNHWQLVTDLSRYFSDDPNLDRNAFIKACGVEDDQISPVPDVSARGAI